MQRANISRSRINQQQSCTVCILERFISDIFTLNQVGMCKVNSIEAQFNSE